MKSSLRVDSRLTFKYLSQFASQFTINDLHSSYVNQLFLFIELKNCGRIWEKSLRNVVFYAWREVIAELTVHDIKKNIEIYKVVK